MNTTKFYSYWKLIKIFWHWWRNGSTEFLPSSMKIGQFKLDRNCIVASIQIFGLSHIANQADFSAFIASNHGWLSEYDGQRKKRYYEWQQYEWYITVIYTKNTKDFKFWDLRNDSVVIINSWRGPYYKIVLIFLIKQ